jgi:putative intracellular protease/amidase
VTRTRFNLIAAAAALYVGATPSLTAQSIAPQRMTVGIMVFPGVQVIDFAGPFEIFDTHPSFNVVLIGPTMEPLTAVGGMRILPNHSFDRHPELDVLVVPGGEIFAFVGDTTYLNWIRVA